MFPGGMNPTKMQGMMKKMGISQEQLPVRRVIFEMDDGNLVIEEPSVLRVKMQGQETYQVSGEAVLESEEELFSDDDVEMVMGQTGKSIDEVRAVLERVDGDLAEAILAIRG
ncbi:MAG: nascent polypeptide-associated complex protein [Nanoarchaeota archaeon]|nr:nascent polypeptide-associated complex protein [Nanoarchaeota archaeon]